MALDWATISDLAASSEDFADEQADELFPQLADFSPGDEQDPERLAALFLVTKAVMLAKGVQADVYLEELEKQAETDGRNGAQMEAELLEQIDALKRQVAVSNEGNLLAETEKKYQQAQLLLKEEEAKNEKLQRKFESISQQEATLRAEVQSLQDELGIQRERGAKQKESEGEMGKKIKEKNRNISQLLNDIEVLESENTKLSVQVDDLKEKLSDGTSQMEQSATRLEEMKDALLHAEQMVSNLQDENSSLRIRLEDATQQKWQQETKLDEATATLEAKLEEWKSVVAGKDFELEEMRQQVTQLLTETGGQGTVKSLRQIIQERDDQLESLKQQLTDATSEMETTRARLHDSKEDIKSPASGHAAEDIRKKLLESQKYNKKLQKSLENAEEDAKIRTEEVTDAVARLREYLSGEFGLQEAVAEIKQLRRQLQQRDRQHEELVQRLNKAELALGDSKEENLNLRSRLSLHPVDTATSSAETTARREQSLAQILQKEVEALEEERLQLKLQARKLAELAGERAATMGLSEDDLEDLQEYANQLRTSRLTNAEAKKDKYLEVELSQLKGRYQEAERKVQKYRDENGKLLQGMQEILKSIKDQEGRGRVQVECPSLERLLAAHGLEESQNHDVHQLLVKTQDLSNQLLTARSEIDRLEAELQKSAREEIRIPVPELPKQEAPLKQKVKEEKPTVGRVDKEASRLWNELGAARERSEQLKRKNVQLKEEMKEKEEEWSDKHQALKETVAGKDGKIQELELQLDNVKTMTSGDASARLVEVIRELAAAKERQAAAEVRASETTHKATMLLKEREDWRKSVFEAESRATEQIGALQRAKDFHWQKVCRLQQALLESVPVSVMEEMNGQYNEVCAKFQRLLQKQKESADVKPLKKQIKALQEQKESLESEFQLATKKIQLLEDSVNALDKSLERDVDEHQIKQLTQEVTRLQMQYATSKQQAERLERLNQRLREQLGEQEIASQAMETKLNEMIDSVAGMQNLEEDLRNQLLHSVSKDEYLKMKEQIQKLESKETEVVLENQKLRDVSTIAEKQLKDVMNRRELNNVELQSLRQQLNDLKQNAVNDSLNERMGEELMSTQLSLKQETQITEALKRDMAAVNGRCTRLEQQLVEREEALVDTRHQAITRFRHLHKLLQDMRRQYSGAVPLKQQEDSIKIIEELRRRLEQLAEDHERSETSRIKAEIRLESLGEVKRASASNEMDALILTWREKLETLAVKEASSSRLAARLQEEVMHLKALNSNQEVEVTRLGGENARLLHSLMPTFEENVPTTDKNAKLTQLISLLTKQAEQSGFDPSSSGVFSSRLDDKDAKIRQLQNSLVDREKLIGELKLKSLQGKVEHSAPLPSMPMVSEKDMESALKAAKLTVDSLKARLTHKEETISRLMQLVQEAREEHMLSSKKHAEELMVAQQALHTLQKQVLQRLRKNLTTAVEGSENAIVTQLQGRVLELEAALKRQEELSQTLQEQAEEARAQEEAHTGFKNRLNTELMSSKNLWEKERGGLLEELDQAKEHISFLEKEVAIHREAAERAPSKQLKKMADRMRLQLQEKDKQNQQMSAALLELKNEMTQVAEKDEIPNIQALIDKQLEPLKRQLRDREDEISELELTLSEREEQLENVAKNENKLKRQIAEMKQKVAASSAVTRKKMAAESKVEAEKIKALSKDVDDLNDRIRKMRTEKEKELQENALHMEKQIKAREEISRWEESKKWQKTIEKLKMQLKEHDTRVKGFESSNKGLKDTIERLQRDRSQLDRQLRSVKTASAKPDDEKQKLEQDLMKTKQELDQLQDLQHMNRARELKRENDFLKAKVIEHEKKLAFIELSTKGGSSLNLEMHKLIEKESRLEKVNKKLENDALDAQNHIKALKEEAERNQERIGRLEKLIEGNKQKETTPTKIPVTESTSNAKEAFQLLQYKKIAEQLRTAVETMQQEKEELMSKLKEKERIIELYAGSNKESVDVDRMLQQAVSENEKLLRELKKCREEKEQLQERHSELAVRLKKAELDLRDLSLGRGKHSVEMEKRIEQLETQIERKTQLLGEARTLLRNAIEKHQLLEEKIRKLESKREEKSR